MNTIRNILLSVLFPMLVSVGNAASIPAMNVEVSNAAGKSIYKGTTNANGTFTTGSVAPGNYVVQFVSKSPVKGKLAISATAGKNTMSDNAVSAEKFADPGVAMRLKVDSNTKITTQVAPAGALAQAAQPVAGATSAKGKPEGPVKIIDGKRYIWVRPQSSTLTGGEWVEESKAAAAQGKSGKLETTQPRPAATNMGY